MNNVLNYDHTIDYRRYAEFQKCITETLSIPCGNQAAQFYCGLFTAQVGHSQQL